MDERDEKTLCADIGMKMAERFQLQHGHPLPANDIEFAGMLAIAFMLGRKSKQPHSAGADGG